MDSTDSLSADSRDANRDKSSGQAHDFSGLESEATKAFDKLRSDAQKSLAGNSTGARFERLGNFRIVEQIGRGGMGEVYLASEEGLDRRVALKVLPAATRFSQTQVKRFLLEAKAAAQLSHDHIVPVYNIGEHEGIHFFTMRYIEGLDLSQIIRTAQRALRDQSGDEFEKRDRAETLPRASDSTVKNSSDPSSERIDLSVQSFVGALKSGGARSTHKLAVSVALIGQAVAEALHHAHQHGIVHRDIKPSNLMLDQHHKIWVTDFGLAQLQSAPAMTVTGDILGTLRYMSPEQATGRRAFIDHRTDIYSLGVTLYELATLQKACRGDSAQEILRSITFERPLPIRKINPRLPRDLETILCKATERNPLDRYQTAHEFAADLRRFANNESLEARRPGPIKRIRNWAGDHPGIATLVVLTLLGVASSLAVTSTVLGNAWNQEKNSRIAVEKALETREAQTLLGMGSLLRDENPGLGLAAALDGAEVLGGAYADRVIMDIVDRNHELRTIDLGLDYPGTCDVSADGAMAVLCVHPNGYERHKQPAALVDLTTGKVLGRLSGNAPVTSAAFLDGTDWLLTNAASMHEIRNSLPLDEVKFGGTRLWNIKTLEYRELASSQALRISKANYSRNNQQLVIPNNGHSATLYNLPGLDQAMVLPRLHEQPVIDCKFSPDGKTIVTWSMDKTAIIWDAMTGQKLTQFTSQTSRPAATHVYFTADSNQICLSNDSGTEFVSCSSGESLRKRAEQLICIGARADWAYYWGPFQTSVLVCSTTSHETLYEFDLGGFVHDVALVANERFLAGMQEESVVVYDLVTGKQVAELKGHTSEIASLAAVSDREQLISSAWDGTLRQWALYSDLERRTIRKEINASQPLVIRPNIDGTKALIGSHRQLQTTTYNVSNLRAAGQLNGKLALTLANNQVVTYDQQELVRWDLATQRRLAAAVPNADAKFAFDVDRALELTPGGTIALLSTVGELYFWRPSTGLLTQQAIRGQFIADMVSEPDGQKLILGLASGELLSLDVASGVLKPLTILPGRVVHLDLNLEHNQVVATCAGSRAVVWDLPQNQQVAELKKPGVRISEARLVSGNRIVTHGSREEKEMILWDLATGQIIDTQSLEKIHEMVVRPDGRAVAAAAESGAYYWDLDTLEKSTVLEEPCKTLAFVSDKLVVATGSYVANDWNEPLSPSPAELVVWNSDTKQIEAKLALDAHVTTITSLRNGEFLASTFAFGVDCVDLRNNRSISTTTGHLQPVLTAAFQADGDEVWTASEDGKILLHSMSSGKYTLLASHDYPMTIAQFSSDMQFLLTADQVAGLRIWDLSAKKQVKEISLGGKRVTRLITNSADTHALVQLEKYTLKHLDLRTGVEHDLEIAAGVRDAALSPDGRTVLVATGEENYIPGNAIYTEFRLTEMELSPLLVFGVNPRHESKLAIEGFPVGCQFIGDGRQFATLSSLGVVQVFDTQSLKQVSRLLSDRRVMQLLDAPAKSPWLFTAAKHQICAWNPSDGTRVQELSLNLTETQAALRLPHELLKRTVGDFYLLGDRTGIKQRPIDAIRYAQKIAPQRLTAEARQKLLNSMQAN